MKGISKIFVLLGILLLAYSVIGRFVGRPTLGFGIITFKAITGVVCANSLLILSLVIKQFQD